MTNNANNLTSKVRNVTSRVLQINQILVWTQLQTFYETRFMKWIIKLKWKCVKNNIIVKVQQPPQCQVTYKFLNFNFSSLFFSNFLYQYVSKGSQATSSFFLSSFRENHFKLRLSTTFHSICQLRRKTTLEVCLHQYCLPLTKSIVNQALKAKCVKYKIT